MQSALYDAAGHRRSPVTMPGFHTGRAPRNKGRRYPADPPPVEEIIAVMRATGNTADGARPQALIVILWRRVYGWATRSLSTDPVQSRSLSELPHHPHIQHANLGVT